MTTRAASVLLTALVAACSAGAEPAVLDASPTATESATPGAEVAYVAWGNAEFTVIASAEADALFSETTTCTNDVGGYRVHYPARWFTNEPGEAPACSWFGPEPFAAHAGTKLIALARPARVPIGLSVMRTGLGQILEQPRLRTEAVVVGGIDAHRIEDLIQNDPPRRAYGYQAWLDIDPAGWKFMAGTSSSAHDDYMLNKAVLDRMMATLRFED